MKKLIFLITLLCLTSLSAKEQEVKYVLPLPNSQQSVTLYSDGTWIKKKNKQGKMDDVVKVKKALLFTNPEEYGLNSISLRVTYTSSTTKSIAGLTVHILAKTPFGKVILDEDADITVSLPRKGSKVDDGWIFKDNPFIDGETYDNLFPLTQTDDFKPVTVTIKKVIFANGATFEAK